MLNTVLPQLGDLEVSVKFELGDANFPKLTLYGHRNSSSLHLQPADEETDDDDDDDGGHSAASYCCGGPVRPTSETINHIVCLLRLSNDTLSSAAEKKKFLKTQEGCVASLHIMKATEVLVIGSIVAAELLISLFCSKGT